MTDSPDPIDVNLTAERLGRTHLDLPPVPLSQNEQAWEDLRADGGLPESQQKDDMTLSLHRCKECGCRWLLWPDVIHGGGWNLLDKYSSPGKCCDNAPMGEQIEHLRDIPLQSAPTGAATPPQPTALCERCNLNPSRVCLGCATFAEDLASPTPTEGALDLLLAEWDAEVKEHGIWTSGHSIAARMAERLRSAHGGQK